jgi:predicted nucleic acid-binding Zn ribbon protein
MARVPDVLVKYLCPECGEQFIVSERLAAECLIGCPYCNGVLSEAIAIEDNSDRLNELGCLGIYHDE